MLRYLVSRGVRALVTIFLVLSFAFVILRLSGDPALLILSPDAVEKYNTLFRFLFPIKRVQIELQNIWS